MSEIYPIKIQEKSALLLKAEEGDPEALRWFLRNHHCKVYTKEEVAVLNFLLKRRRQMEEQPVIDCSDKDLVVELPTLNEHTTLARINWLQQLEEDKPYYLAGLTYLKGDREGGCTEWVFKLENKELKPMFCALYWEEVL